jgi:predicted house-cleaning noncanonical NTP pyrophosphatase (MazG superfamily)
MASNLKTYRKLVRDFIPAIIRRNGHEPKSRQLSLQEYRVALSEKAHEELRELTEASGPQVVEELADLLEVLRAVAVADGFSWEEVEEATRKKRKERGGFEGRVWLESVLETEG